MTRATVPLIALLFAGAACTLGEPVAPSTPAPTPAPPVTPVTPPPTRPPVEPTVLLPDPEAGDLAGEPRVFVTHHGVDGNRYARGRGALPDAAPVDLPLGGAPEWVVGALVGGEAVWVVALEDGRLEAWVVRAGRGLPVRLPTSELPPGAPPAVLVSERGELGVLPPGSGSPFTHPMVPAPGVLATVGVDGVVRIDGPGDEATQIDAGALPDARLLTDGDGRLLLLGGATDRYPHGVLGDSLEGSRVAMYDPAAEPSVSGFVIAEPEVVEGIAPIWADLDGEEGLEIVLTLSDDGDGARIAAFDPSGAEVATGPPIGSGQRWRHQIAVAPFGPGGETELAAVRTPHIGGVVEFYRRDGAELVIVATVPGFASHGILSRNLDLALAADADGDGRVELVVPTQDRTSFGGVRRTGDGAEVAWNVPLDGSLATNLAAVELPDGGLSFAAGRADGVLRVWPADG